MAKLKQPPPKLVLEVLTNAINQEIEIYRLETRNKLIFICRGDDHLPRIN